MNNAYIFTQDNVTIYSAGRSYIVSRKFAEFAKLTSALSKGDYKTAIKLADKAATITSRSDSKFVIENGTIYNDGVAVHNVVADRILEFVEQGLPFKPLMKFLENISLNPSNASMLEGYSFLEHKNLPVTEDGRFLAYKSVQGDYRSKYKGNNKVFVSTDNGATFETFIGHIPNNVGNIVKINRNDVDDDRRKSCSYGLHVGSLEYAGHEGWYHKEGDNIVVVKVNPKDIVCVPFDEDSSKMRVCYYEVIADFERALSEPLVETKPHWWRERGKGGLFLPNE